MAAPTKEKVCKRLVHNGVKRVQCMTIYKGPECPKKNHVLKFKTGFCNNKQCEGTKPKSNGTKKPMPTCKFWQTCPCDCHALLDKMFEETGMERQLIENAEYIPEKVHFNLLDYIGSGDSAPHSIPATGDVPTGDERPVAPAARASLASRRTETGRAAKGGLEAQVWEVCRQWTDAPTNRPDQCTTRYIAETICDKYHIPTPSVGAIRAVFMRWVDLDYVEIATDPLRFKAFIKTGSYEELELMKARKKRMKKMTQSNARRGIRT